MGFEKAEICTFPHTISADPLSPPKELLISPYPSLGHHRSNRG